MFKGDRLLRFVAQAYFVDALDQWEIAKLTGVSRSTVSRLLTQARERGVVRISVDQADPRCRDLESGLCRGLGLRQAVVVHTLGSSEPSRVRRQVGYVAAAVVAKALRPRSVVGVAGGRTLADLVRYVPTGSARPGVRVAQLMGNIGPTADAFDAIELSRGLAERVGGTCYALNAPAFAQDRRARDVLLSHTHLREVWRLFGVMDVALVGIGTLVDSAFIERGVLAAADLDRLRGHGAVGEICGRFFDARGEECASPYRHRVVSIELRQLASTRDVVAVTNGAHRAEAIRAAVAGGVVKSLVIDQAGAEALLAAPAAAGRPAGARGKRSA